MSPPRDLTFVLFGIESGEYSWRGLLYLLALLIGSLLFAAVLSPLVFWGMAAWVEASPNALNIYLAEKSFPRYFDRLRWLAVLLCLPWLMKRCSLWSWSRLGFAPTERAWGDFLRWMVLGLVLLLVVVVLQFNFGNVDSITSMTVSEVGILIFSGLLSGLLVGFLEETVFRGIVFRIFYTALRPIPAAVICSLLFAALHFKKIPETVWSVDSVVSAASGLEMAFWTLFSVTQTFDPQHFVTLFLVGLVLTLVFMRTRSLWSCWGMHAGWVWLLAVSSSQYQVGDGSGTGFLGTQRLIDGWLTPSLLAGAVVWLYLSHITRTPPAESIH